MENIKWYHIAIVCAIILIILYFIFYRPKSTESFTTPEATDTTSEIILYYATWCGPSKQFLPIWQQFENYSKNNLKTVKVSSVICEGDNEAKCKETGLRGYPTVILYLKDGTVKMFDGERSVDGLTKFIQQNDTNVVLERAQN